MTRSRRNAFSLIELLLAIIFLSMVMLGIMYMTSASNKSSMDAYYEYMAVQLALEPIEIFRSFGYDWLTNYGISHSIPEYPVGGWADIKDPMIGGIIHPAEVSLFQREITLTPVNDGGLRGIRIRVSVAPKNQSRARIWLLRSDVSMESLIMEKPR